MRTLESDNNLSLIQEGNNATLSDHEHGIFQVAHSTHGSQVVRPSSTASDNTACAINSTNTFTRQSANNEVPPERTQLRQALSANAAIRTERSNMFNLPTPTWTVTVNDRSAAMLRFILDNDLSLEGLSDDQLAALSEADYQKLLDQESRRHEQALRERTIRA